jgi:catechol 2,3-dioxygenase-like lactoylglutathione lyase family enzyme
LILQGLDTRKDPIMNTAPTAAVQGMPYIEHVNLTVTDLDTVTHFLTTALPHWRVRGNGSMDWYGKHVSWRHVGDDRFYLALQGGGVGASPHWQSHERGVKHIGLVVPSIDAAIARLAAAGFALDHMGGSDAMRRSAYVMAGDELQFEFVEYATEDTSSRNLYAPTRA